MFLKPQYTMYADESGTEAMTPKSLAKDRYLAISACIIRRDRVAEHLRPKFLELKLKHFPGIRPQDIQFHRTDIMKRSGVFSVLANPEKAALFDNDLLQIFDELQYRLLTAVLDKQMHLNSYNDKAKHTYHYCAEAVLERYCLYLKNQNAVGDVIFESRDAKLNRQLEDIWAEFWNYGTTYLKPNVIQSVLTSSELKLKPKSAGYEGLQLVDMLCNPAKRSVLVEYDRATAQDTDFAISLEYIMNKKFDCHWNGKKRGYGKVFLLPSNEKAAM